MLILRYYISRES